MFNLEKGRSHLTLNEVNLKYYWTELLKMDGNYSSDVFVGICQAMCPLAEYQERKRQKRLSVFEITPSTHKNLPVKEFSRSAAGRQTNVSELRPEGVLLKTMKYLIDEIVDRKDHDWTVVYHFVFDRIRAIRQDLVIQRIKNETTVDILEKAVRFHIFAHRKLVGCSLDFYDPHINDHHLQECVKRLLVLYDHNVLSQNRTEFELYYLLNNLNSHEAIHRILTLPQSIKAQGDLKTALDLSLMLLLGNFVAFFKTVKKLPFLAHCLVRKHFVSVRCHAIAVMNTAFSNLNCKFPLTLFCNILSFKSIDAARDFVLEFGIEVDDDCIKFSKKSFMEPSKTPTDCTRDYSVPEDEDVVQTAKEILQGRTSRSIQPLWRNNKSNDKTSFTKDETEHSIERFKLKTTAHGRGRGVGRCLAGSVNAVVGRARGRNKIENDSSNN